MSKKIKYEPIKDIIIKAKNIKIINRLSFSKNLKTKLLKKNKINKNEPVKPIGKNK